MFLLSPAVCLYFVFLPWSEAHCSSCLAVFINFSCSQVDYTGVEMSSPCFNCSQNFSWNSTRPCTCSIPFYLDQPYEVREMLFRKTSQCFPLIFTQPVWTSCLLLCAFNQQSSVFMYYGLSNFYQNHRRYVKSRDDSQLNGDMESLMVWLKSGSDYRRFRLI